MKPKSSAAQFLKGPGVGASMGCDYCLQNFTKLLLSGSSSVPWSE